MSRRLLVCLIVLCSRVCGFGDTSAETLPPKVQEVQLQIQGTTAEENKRIIDAALGAPSGDLGSGVHIFYWNFPNGRLIGDVIPKFVFKSGHVVWLIRTHNRVAENLPGSYEMTSTLNCNWLGDILLKPDETYEFTKADNHQNGWFSGQEDNFFLNHPSGAYKIGFPNGTEGDTLLESVPDRGIVATLSLTAKDGAKETYSIVIDNKDRLLSFSSPSSLKWMMSKPWASRLR